MVKRNISRVANLAFAILINLSVLSGLQIGHVSTVFAYPIGVDCGPANDGAYWWDEQEMRWYQCKYDFQLQGWYWIQSNDPPVARDTGKAEPVLASNFPQSLQHVRIKNGSPGLKNLTVEVNGRTFEVADLHDSEERIIAISSALAPTPNEVRLIAHGKPGGTAAVFIER